MHVGRFLEAGARGEAGGGHATGARSPHKGDVSPTCRPCRSPCTQAPAAHQHHTATCASKRGQQGARSGGGGQQGGRSGEGWVALIGDASQGVGMGLGRGGEGGIGCISSAGWHSPHSGAPRAGMPAQRSAAAACATRPGRISPAGRLTAGEYPRCLIEFDREPPGPHWLWVTASLPHLQGCLIRQHMLFMCWLSSRIGCSKTHDHAGQPAQGVGVGTLHAVQCLSSASVSVLPGGEHNKCQDPYASEWNQVAEACFTTSTAYCPHDSHPV